MGFLSETLLFIRAEFYMDRLCVLEMIEKPISDASILDY